MILSLLSFASLLKLLNEEFGILGKVDPNSFLEFLNKEREFEEETRDHAP